MLSERLFPRASALSHSEALLTFTSPDSSTSPRAWKEWRPVLRLWENGPVILAGDAESDLIQKAHYQCVHNGLHNVSRFSDDATKIMSSLSNRTPSSLHHNKITFRINTQRLRVIHVTFIITHV